MISIMTNIFVRKTKLKINYIDFPEELKGKYQSFTCADLSHLRAQGYNDDFLNIHTGIYSYLEFLEEKNLSEI